MTAEDTDRNGYIHLKPMCKGYSTQISLYRKNMKREKARNRKVRARNKLRKAAEAGDAEACKKIKAIKKYDRERAEKRYLKLKAKNVKTRKRKRAKQKVSTVK